MNLQGNINQLLGQVAVVKKLGDIGSSMPQQPKAASLQQSVQKQPEQKNLSADQMKMMRAQARMLTQGQAKLGQRTRYNQVLELLKNQGGSK